MSKLAYTIASKLLEMKAIKFNFDEPYVWTSGIKSPVYCDNRLTLSDHSLRSIIRDAYAEAIKEKFPQVQVIAGVATGAIAQGALVADKLNLPFVYVREKPKGHGLKKTVEGFIEPGQKTVIIEDLVSTGGSSLRALEELRNVKADVLGMVAAFSYGFPKAAEKFKEKACELHIISSFQMVKDIGIEKGYITKQQAIMLDEWQKTIDIEN